MNSFQSIVLGIFGLFIIAGLIVVATVKGQGDEPAITLTLWGSAPREEVATLTEYYFSDDEKLKVRYTELSAEKLDEELTEALAAGRGPDLILLPLELLLRHIDKLQLIPYTNVSERTFRDTFVQEGDLFLLPKGIAALPFSLDPLVMYWNRDFLDEAGIPTAPKFWDEFLPLARTLVQKDDLDNISRSAVALGEYRNVSHAREILAALFLQSGNSVFELDAATGARKSTLNQPSAPAVLDFYTEFANPVKPVYSWNRAFPASRNQFLAAKLAVYFGFGSEYRDLQKANPNLNFDVALFPRPRNARVGITYGKLTGIGILRVTRNPSAALKAALLLSSAEADARLVNESGLPPVHRGLLRDKPTDAFGAIMYDSASRSRGFLDPYPARSSGIFQAMVEAVTSGKSRSGEAINKAGSELQNALR